MAGLTKGSLSIASAGALGLTTSRAEGGERAKGQPKLTCTALVMPFPDHEARIVTAKHCLSEGLQVFDADHSLSVSSHRAAPGAVDLASLAVEGPLPFPPLQLRASSSLQIGERLCALRIETTPSGPSRQEICGRFLGFEARDDAPPTLRLSSPFPRGTSGGPLLDADGKLVGVVVASQGEYGIAEAAEAALVLTEAPACS